MGNEFVVYQSKVKQIGLSLLGIMMVIASLAVFFAGLADKQYVMILIGGISFAFFGFCEIAIVKQVIKGKKVVVLTSEGFYDYSSALSTKGRMISWSDVSRIEDTNMVGQEFVSVFLKEPEKFLEQLSSMQRTAVKANIKLGFGEINITLQSAKRCTNDQLIAQMNTYLPEEKDA